MVEFRTPTQTPTARAAGQVSRAGSQALDRLSGAVGQAADTFTDFYEKEASIQGELLLAEVQEEWTRGYSERAKTAGAGFAKQTMADYDKFVADRLSQWQQEATEGNQRNVPARVMDDVKLSLDKYRLRLETQSLQREAAARAAAKAAAVASAERAKLNALIIDPSLMGEMVEGAKTQKQRSSYIQTGLTATMRDNPELVLEQVMSGQYVNDLSPSQTQSFIKLATSGVEKQQREAEILLKGQQAQFETELSEELAFTEANGAPPVDSVFNKEAVRDLYANDPEKGEEIIRTYNEGIAFSETVHEVSLASPETIEAEALRLQEEVSKPGDTASDVTRLNAYLTAVGAREKAIRDDAASYVQKNVDSVSKMYEMHGAADPEVQPIVAENYLTALNAMYDDLGVQPQFRNVLPKGAVSQTVASLNGMGSDVAAQALSQIATSWGDAAPMVIAQLEKGGLAKEYVVAMRHADNPSLSQAIVNLASQTLPELKTGLPTTSVKDFSDELNESLMEYREAFEFSGGPAAAETFNRNFEVAQKLGVSLIRGGSDPSAAAVRVVEQMFPETVLSGNNENLVLPAGLDEGTIGMGLDMLRGEDNLRGADIQPINDPRYPDFADLEVTISAASRSGVWANDSTGRGAQLMILVDGAYIPLMRSDGLPYSFTFEQLRGAGTPVPGGQEDLN